MRLPRVLRNEKGMAMVLAMSMIGLLSLFGVWMLVESQTSFRVTSSMERRESAFNLAEAALQLDYRCILDNSLSPTYENLTSSSPQDITPSGVSYMGSEQSLGREHMTLTPKIYYLSYTTTAPPGWMLNWQGSSSFYGVYYRARGDGTLSLPSGKGNAKTELSALMLRVTR